MRSIDPAAKRGEQLLFSEGRKLLGEVDERRFRLRLNQIYRTIADANSRIKVSSLYGVRIIQTELKYEPLETRCSIFMESGRLSLLDGVDDPYTPAQLEFSSDLDFSSVFKAAGTMISAIHFKIPITPNVQSCSGISRSVSSWGLSGGSIVGGESRVVTCPVCERNW